VAKGYGQTKGVDYTHTYALVARLSTFRLLLELTSALKLDLQQYDIVLAYLNGDMEDDEVYVQQPIEFDIPRKEDHV